MFTTIRSLKIGVFLGLTAVLASSQVARTTLTGTVTDEQSRRVPQAMVKVTDSGTGLQREAQTSIQGSYTLAGLPAGSYRVEISKPGFADFHAESLKQEVGQTRTLDVVLHVAGKTEEAMVSESLFQLDRVDATVGSPIERALVDELPVNGKLVHQRALNGRADRRVHPIQLEQGFTDHGFLGLASHMQHDVQRAGLANFLF